MNNLSFLLEAKKQAYNQEIDKLDNLPISNSYESRCIYGFYNLTVEHYASILHLCDIGHWGSAFSLLRVCREACLRGSFLHRCADKRNWDYFKLGKQPDTTEEMISKMDAFLEQDIFCKQDYKFLHDLTHTGAEHIFRRTLRTTAATVYYPEEEITNLLNCSEAMAILAIAGMIDLSTLPDKEKIALANVENRYQQSELYPSSSWLVFLSKIQRKCMYFFANQIRKIRSELSSISGVEKPLR